MCSFIGYAHNSKEGNRKMKNIRLDIYDIQILVDIQKQRGRSIRKLAERLPLKKTQVGARIRDMTDLGLLTMKGATKGAKRALTDKGVRWLEENGYLNLI
jgi:predicted transcriptional regulator